MPTINVNADTFENEVLKAEVPTLVEFWAPWCGPCRGLAPTLEVLADEYPDTLKVAKVNIDENPELANLHNITSIPTMYVFVEGDIKKELIGVFSKSDLTEEVTPYL